MPKKSGLQVLSRLRNSQKCGNIPVALISSSRPPTQNTEADYRAADYFFTKPSDYDRVMDLGGIVKGLLQGPGSVT